MVLPNKPITTPILRPVLMAVAITAILATAGLSPATPALAEEGKVNVNTASERELALLPRIGPAIAGRIVEFRQENGPFKATEDLMLVRGIGEKTFEDLEPFISLEGETTLTEKVRASSLDGDDRR